MTVGINPPATPLTDAKGFVTPPWYRYFVQRKAQADGAGSVSGLTVTGESNILPNSRYLTVTTGDLVLTDGGAGMTLDVSLADVGTAGPYGTASKTIAITTDDKGRVIGAVEYDLDSDNVAEGAVNLFYTDARARNALSAGTGLSYNSTSGSIALANTAVTPATYGAANKSATVAIDQQGRVTAASDTTITIAAIIGASTAPDGTYLVPTSITIKNGVITAIS